jgi:Protein of unknown function (DUF2815)
MVDKVKIEPKIITIHEGRVSFFNAITPKYRTDKFGREVKTRPDGSPVKPQYRMTWLLDPSNAQAQATIKEIKDEAARQLDLYFGGRDKWPKDNTQTGTKGVLPCFGNGNDLPKVYDGYKDMFFIKVADSTAPIIGDRQGRQVVFLADNAWHVVDQAATKAKGTVVTTEEIVDPAGVPYGGAYCRGRISLYIYNNEQAGVNANFRSIQFLRPGEAFGSGGRRNVSEELQAMAGDAPVATATSEADPW